MAERSTRGIRIEGLRKRYGQGDTAVDALKHVYLECERAAIGGGLRGGDVMHCSIIYEELKRRAFGGDFGRLKAWCDSQLRPLSMSHASVRSA